jgi:hypothetical protein
MKEHKEKDLPLAIEKWGWKYHHLGIPTNEKLSDANYLPKVKLSVKGFKTSPFGVEWMEFDEDCTIHKLIKTVPHLALIVEDLDFELKTKGFNILSEPSSPMESIRVAMIEYDRAPIELTEFKEVNSGS